jgi:glycosyltransferase involved in cell wall biosynthesis
MKVIYQICSFIGKDLTWEAAIHAVNYLRDKGILKKLISLNTFYNLKLNNSNIINKKNLNTIYLFRPLYRNKTINNILLPTIFDKISSKFFVEKCDIFHGWVMHSLFSIKKAKKLGSKTILEVGNAHILEFMKILTKEARIWGLKYDYSIFNIKRVMNEYMITDYILVPSEYARQSFLKQGFPAEKIKKLNFGIDPDECSPNNYEHEKFRIIYTGAVTLGKGIQYLLSALQNLRLKNAELLVVGGIDDSMKNLITQLLRHIQIPVTFFGRVPRKILLDLLSKSSLYVFPSLSDGWAMTVPEAMARGLPVITTKNVGSSELIEDGKEGFVIPIRDVKSLRDYILYFYDNPSEVKRMGKNSFNKINKYTWEKYGYNLIKIYNEILQK